MSLHTRLVMLGKELIVRSPLRWRVLPRYTYFFNAAQLIFLCECLEQTRDTPGCIVEVGAAFGETTLFLNNYLDAAKIDKPYFAIDTFAGFAPHDVAFEVRQRGKASKPYENFDGLHVNSKAWFDATMQLNHVTRVRSIQTDVNEFDFGSLGEIAFCLLDVDLYLPTRRALSELYAATSPGGILVVDDCAPEPTPWDGAREAYREFMLELGKPTEPVMQKLGVIRK